MTRTALALTALLMATAAHAQPYDDPAVIACEELAKHDVPDRGKYVRQSAAIAGSTVTLKYQVQIMTAAPEDKSVVCPFKLNEKTKFFNYYVAEPGPDGDRAHARATLIMMSTGLYPIAKDKTALR